MLSKLSSDPHDLATYRGGADDTTGIRRSPTPRLPAYSLKSMRLLITVPTLLSYRSFLLEIAAALLSRGDELHIACDAAGAETASLARPGLHFHDIAMPRGVEPRRHWRAARDLGSLVTTISPDVVHAHFSASIFTAALARDRSFPATVGTFHGVRFLAEHGAKAALVGIAERWASARLDAVWVLTQDDEQALRQAVPRADVRRYVGYCFGSDVERFVTSRAEREARRRYLGFASDDVVFAFVGRFAAFKGFGDTVRAFLRLSGESPRGRLLLVGEPDALHPTGLTDSEYQSLLTSPRVTRVGWTDAVQDYVSAADVFVFPSRREGLPVCIMEALSAGLPVVTCDSRGCRDVVRDGIDGFVVAQSQPEALFRAMRTLLDDTLLRARMGASAARDAHRFSRAHHVNEQLRIYDALHRTQR